MPLQNRVDPWGNLVAISARGQFLGNRGILHNDEKAIVSPWKHKNWVTCSLSFKGIKREVFSPNSYSELFFLDEATALSAGHRPCAHCRRERYNEFKNYWRKLYEKEEHANSTKKSLSAAEIDKQLHRERVSENRTKRTYTTAFENIAEGTFIAHNGEAYLFWNGLLHKWTHKGYENAISAPIPNEGVEVITPKSIVDLYRLGFKPLVCGVN
jgi:hypothetical protein